ncbi:MarR family transcriptional regulator [Arthrobacter sp. MN05-02]|nr:MarR family transcriptional regulator [Arthrobacter sp. MN05-02]
MNRATEPPAGDQPGSPIVRDYPLSAAILAIGHGQRSLAASLLGGLGLFPGQELLLMQLWDQDGLSQKSLGAPQRLDHSTVAKSVRRLEAAGLITRSRSATDGRVTLVFLTDAGRALRGPVTEAWSRLQETVAAGLTDEEQDEFTRLARKILDGMDRAGLEAPQTP